MGEVCAHIFVCGRGEKRKIGGILCVRVHVHALVRVPNCRVIILCLMWAVGWARRSNKENRRKTI